MRSDSPLLFLNLSWSKRFLRFALCILIISHYKQVFKKIRLKWLKILHLFRGCFPLAPLFWEKVNNFSFNISQLVYNMRDYLHCSINSDIFTRCPINSGRILKNFQVFCSVQYRSKKWFRIFVLRVGKFSYSPSKINRTYLYCFRIEIILFCVSNLSFIHYFTGLIPRMNITSTTLPALSKTRTHIHLRERNCPVKYKKIFKITDCLIIIWS